MIVTLGDGWRGTRSSVSRQIETMNAERRATLAEGTGHYSGESSRRRFDGCSVQVVSRMADACANCRHTGVCRQDPQTATLSISPKLPKRLTLRIVSTRTEVQSLMETIRAWRFRHCNVFN
jgi:hypothetical protein